MGYAPAVITGETSPDRLHMLNDSGYPILHKPVSTEHLRDVVRDIVRGSQDLADAGKCTIQAAAGAE